MPVLTRSAQKKHASTPQKKEEEKSGKIGSGDDRKNTIPPGVNHTCIKALSGEFKSVSFGGDVPAGGMAKKAPVVAPDQVLSGVAADTGTPPKPPVSATSSSEAAPGSRRSNEVRRRKILTRSSAGLAMVFVFALILYSGHMYVCLLIATLEVMLFRELVRVRYSHNFDRIENTVPLFRTTQWMWFLTAVFYAYSEFCADVVTNNTALHHLLPYAQSQMPMSFLLYSAAIIITIMTLRIDHIKFQFNQICWTILVLCFTLGNLKYVMHNVFNGLFWFTFPTMTVIMNDIAAYICGMTCGRKIIKKPFFSLSPNKTWEGFIGGALITTVFGWYFSKFLSEYMWMTCPVNMPTFFQTKLECDVNEIFLPAKYIIPEQVLEIIPRPLARMIPGITEMCYEGACADGVAPPDIVPCVREADTHHHFHLLVTIVPIQLHSVILSVFGSLVAPFGGFFASAIKRAYGIKDFDSIIPGHGGAMDRFDCQLLMMLYTWVHYNTFVKMATASVPKMLYMYNLLSEGEKEEFIQRIMEVAKAR